MHPDNAALLLGSTVVADYRKFRQEAASVAAGLIAAGVAPGDRVAIFAGNSVHYLRALYGIWYAGGVAVPINAKLHANEAAWIIENADCKLVFVEPRSRPALDKHSPAITSLDDVELAPLMDMAPVDAPIAREASDLCWLFYTSGTTGRPKGVMITHGNVAAMTACYFIDVDTVEAEDAALYAAPLSHGAGLYNFMHVMRGARHVIPASGGFRPDEIFSLARALGRIHMFAAPTMVKRLVAASPGKEDTAGIKTIVYGGGPMYLADIIDATRVLGPRLAQIYGQGESPMTITAMAKSMVSDRNHPRWRDRLASVGRAQSLMEVGVIGSQGQSLPCGTVGEVVVRGPAVMAGYWRNPDATAAALQDGWLRTGDMGSFDQDGFLTLKDRSKDVIISGGTNIYPREVEEALLSHEAVADVSVIGAPDDEWGEIVVAYVVLRDGATADEGALDAHCLESIARFKRPKAYVFMDRLPKNNYGKVLKTALREDWRQRA